MRRMARVDTQVNVRIPDELLAQLRAAAESSGRSLTAEVVARLESTFRSVEAEMLNARMAELSKLEASLEMALSDQRVHLHRLENGDFGPYGKEWLEGVLKTLHERINRLTKLKYELSASIASLMDTNSSASE
jgi:plasmid stability protein